MNRYDVIRFIAMAVFILGILLYVDAFQSKSNLTNVSAYGTQVYDSITYHRFHEDFTERQQLGGLLATVGGGLVFAQLWRKKDKE